MPGRLASLLAPTPSLLALLSLPLALLSLGEELSGLRIPGSSFCDVVHPLAELRRATLV